ncbi:MAG: ABC transporter substrate-binding protein, partial [Ilumatobacteraceae bacterium]
MRSRRSWRQLTAVTLVAATLFAACGGDDDDDGGDSSTPVVTEQTTPDTTAAGSDTTAAGSDTTTADTGAPSTTAASDITMGGSLTVGIDGEAACYVPHLCSVSYGPGGIRFGVLENLVRPANNTDGYEMQLAESIEPNDDFTQFTVTLRDGVQWSDGTPMTAGDIKTLFDTYVFAEASTLKGNVAAISSTEAPDDRTVVFTLSAPQAPFPVNLTNVPIYKPVEGLEQTSIPIGTGPFVMESWEPNVQTVLKKNPLYWGTDADGNQLPYLDEIVVVPITSGDTRVNSLESGDIDIAMSTDPLISASLRDRSTVYEVGLNAGNGLFFNAASPPTDDVRVRRALAFATNKDDIMAAIGGGEPRDEYYVPESEWYSEEASAETPGFDTEQAQTLLDEYINDPARSDGKPAGTPLTIDISVVQGAITAESIAAIAQQQWAEIGVDVTITPKDQSTLIGDAISGNFNVNYFGWATPHPYSLLVRNYGKWPDTPSNYTHFNSEELFDIVAKMSVAKTPDEMAELIRQSNQVIAEGVPVIFLHSTPLVWGTNDEVG